MRASDSGGLRLGVRGSEGEGGFSLVELMTAMGVFSILMVIVSSAMISGFNGIKTTMAKSEVQQQNQLAAEWISRALMYALVPEGKASAIEAATVSSITFYTNASLGLRSNIPYNEVPYQVILSVDNTSSTTKTYVKSRVVTPVRASVGWTYNDAILPATSAFVVNRTLLTLPKTTSPLTIGAHSCDMTSGVCTLDSAVTLPMTSSTIVAPRVPSYVSFTIGDPADPRNVISRIVRLENLA
jgi:prepilin-type N-terminal cleavage/methylation domain-containing protein